MPASAGLTLGAEVEEGGELSAFVVPPQQEDCVLEFEFDCQDESQHFDREAASVDVVSEEDVLGGVEGPAGVVVDDLDEIVELSVDVSDDGDGVLDADDVGLLFWVWAGIRKVFLALLRSSKYSFLWSFPSRL